MNQRMSLSSSLVLPIAIAFIGSAGPSVAQNLLVNGAFDTDASEWGAPNADVTIVYRAEVGNTLAGGSGPGSMEVQYWDWGGTASGAVQTVEVEAGTVYEFSGAVFTPSIDNPTTGVRAYAYWLDGTGSLIAGDQLTDFPPLVSDQWTPIQGSGAAPLGARAAQILLAVQNPSSPTETNPGVAIFDDLWFAPSGTAAAIQRLFVPGAASTPGSGGTFWTTSAWISNLTDSPVVIRGAALLQGRNNESAVEDPTAIGTVEPGGFLRLEDVFHQLGADGATGGLFLEATTDDELPFTRLLAIATYTSTPNQTGDGAYGQGIPATPPGAKSTVVVPGINDSGSHRTNIGVLNSSKYVISVGITIADAMGTEVGTATWSLQPFEQRQQRVTTLGATGLDGGTATFNLLSPEGSFLAYSSVVDNDTGDAVYVAGD